MFRLRFSPTLLLVTLLTAFAVPAIAQGTHTAAAPMTSKRALHTMTRLPSGKVVAIAGTDPFLTYESLVTAEVYDPVTNTWTPTGNLHEGREEHAATLLADGRVLVTGGQNPISVAYSPSTFVLNSAEIFNPATNTFTSVGPMREYRLGHRATRLADGRVLLTGGYNNPGIIYGGFGVNPPQRTASAEIFDPVSQTFTPLMATMTVPRAYHSATLLPDGTVLIVGGHEADTIATAELFDPGTQTFFPITPPTVSRRQPGAIRLDDGRVLIVGGVTNPTAAEYFDPSNGTFNPLPPMAAKFEFWGVLEKMTDGRVYIQYDGIAQVFNPATNTFTLVGPSGAGALFSAGAAISDRRVLVTGGEDFVPFTFVARDAARIFTPNELPVANAGDDQHVSPGANCVATITLNGSQSSDSDGDALTFEWKYLGATVGSAASLQMSLAPGTHAFTLTVNDGKGGTSTDEVIVIVADSTAPSFTSPMPMPATLEQAGPAGTFFAIATPGAIDNCDASPVVTVSGVPAGSIFPQGSTDVTFTAADASGNIASMTIAVTVRDTIAPAVNVPAPMIAEATGPSGAVMNFAASATDVVSTSLGVTCAPASGSVFPIATTLVHCTSTDAAGNTGSASFAVTVRDTTAPVVAVPASLSVPATSSSGAPVSYVVTASDAVTLSPVVTCAPAPGSTFPIGTTTVACSSTDAAGNVGHGSFSVTVSDTDGPVITTVSSDPGQLWPPNHKMVPVRITAVATDNGVPAQCRIENVSSNQPSDDDWLITGLMSLSLRAERLGAGARIYTIGVRCTDATGNSTLGATTVIVPHDQRK